MRFPFVTMSRDVGAREQRCPKDGHIVSLHDLPAAGPPSTPPPSGPAASASPTAAAPPPAAAAPSPPPPPAAASATSLRPPTPAASYASAQSRNGSARSVQGTPYHSLRWSASWTRSGIICNRPFKLAKDLKMEMCPGLGGDGMASVSKGGPWGGASGPVGASSGSAGNPYHHQGNPFHQGAAPGTNSDWWHSSSSLIFYCFCMKNSENIFGSFIFKVEEARRRISHRRWEGPGVGSRPRISTATGLTRIYQI